MCARVIHLLALLFHLASLCIIIYPFLVLHLTLCYCTQADQQTNFSFSFISSPSCSILLHTCKTITHYIHHTDPPHSSFSSLCCLSLSAYIFAVNGLHHTQNPIIHQHVRIFIPRLNHNRGTNAYQLCHLPFKHARQPVHYVHPSRKHYSGWRSRPNHTHIKKMSHIKKRQHRLPASQPPSPLRIRYKIRCKIRTQ